LFVKLALVSTEVLLFKVSNSIAPKSLPLAPSTFPTYDTIIQALQHLYDLKYVLGKIVNGTANL
jgi:hypothetical protein